MSNKVLEIKNLTIEFNDKTKSEIVVRNFDLELSRGEKLGIVGESGSGKSMISLAIVGIDKKEEMNKTGRIQFDNIDILSCEKKILREVQGRRIGIVFQEPMTSLNPVRKIGWQIEEVLKIHFKLSKEERYKKVISVLKKVELDDVNRIYNSYPHQLSGGMRQRVMIAIAIIGEPEILIADEPTTALDYKVQGKILKLIDKINREMNMSIIFVSHDLSIVKELCDRVIVMKDGEKVEEGVAEEIFNDPRALYTKQLINAIPKGEIMTK